METASEMIARAKEYTRKIVNPTPEEIQERLDKEEAYRIQELKWKQEKIESQKQKEYLKLHTTEIGFWTNDYPERLQEVESRIIAGWNKTAEAQCCVDYILAGTPIVRYRGFSSCPICPQKHLGTKDMLHEKWVFPECWEHYILEHSVRPWNEDFIQSAVLWDRNGRISDNTILNKSKSFKTGDLF